MEAEDELIKNIKGFYTSATTVYTDRFSILKGLDPAFYRTLDKYFGYYRKSYSSSLPLGLCDEVSTYVRLFAKKLKVGLGA